jgi:hypothetical protein
MISSKECRTIRSRKAPCSEDSSAGRHHLHSSGFDNAPEASSLKLEAEL